MEINKNRKINFHEENSSKKDIKNNKKNIEIKSTEAASVDALASQGKAFVQMSFKGNQNNTPTANSKFRELSDSEFEEYKNEVNQKINNLPDDISEKLKIFSSNMNKYNVFIFDKITSDENLYNNEALISNGKKFLSFIKKPEKAIIADVILSDERLYKNDKFMKDAIAIIYSTNTQEHLDSKMRLISYFLSDERLYDNDDFMYHAGGIIYNANKKEEADAKLYFINEFLSDKRLENENLTDEIMSNIYYLNNKKRAESILGIINKIFSDERLYGNENIRNNLGKIILHTDNKESLKSKCKTIDEILKDEKLYNDEVFMSLLPEILCKLYNEREGNSFLEKLSARNLPPNEFAILYTAFPDEITLEEIQNLNSSLGIDIASKLSKKDVLISKKFTNIYRKESINEIPKKERKDFLRNLISSNTELFESSNILKQYFPLIPKDKDEYCSLLPKLVNSIGIETNVLNDEQIKAFFDNINNLSVSLGNMSDSEFNNITIKQEYDKDSFIKDTLSALSELSEGERQKVYDYFGFELHSNDKTNTGYSITGYPLNKSIESEELTQISDKKTKAAIEELRPFVIKFSENNKILCSDKELEVLLNDVAEAMPEIHTMVGKVQSGNIREDGTMVGKGSHDFDIFKHSLKVMQKITQNEEFIKLNESDKRIMLLGSLLHDITKREGYTDTTHSDYGSYDSFFISKKFKLTEDETMKLYTLIKHHEWLANVNNAKNEYDLTKRLQNTAYDLRHDNMADLELIFCQADLKAVKKDNSFYSKTEGKGRKDFKGNIRSFGDSAIIYAKRIKEYIQELKTTQPLLPVTEIPKSEVIDQAIDTVNKDGSTNIKGIYKDKDGLIIIKFNEVDDWEKIGFPKGSVSHGIKLTTQLNEKVDTGNIKFFVHGLEYANQVANFDAFSVVDSDALLSVSYAERPESKYRFFRPQGIILDCDTKHIHGGGNTDEGSGRGKDINEFKNNYIFDGKRNEDRKYVAKMIKDATGMNDDEYMEFVKINRNKPFSAIYPEDIRDKIINAFASINSNTRKGAREYNEMYISNPKPPMGVFAYNINENETIGNPVDFLNRKSIKKQEIGYDKKQDVSVYDRTKFLREYALKREIPFIVFGD